MPNEASALPELLAALPDAADYDAVHAALMATEAGRRFLAEFAARNRHADTTMIVAALARVEAAIRGEGASPPTLPPAAAGELVEIAAAIDRIRIAMAAGATRTPKLAAATERIQDLAFMLHERAIDAALRDALDAAVAELTAAVGATSDRDAVEFLHALASRLAEMIGERGGSQPVTRTEELPPPAKLFATAASGGEAFAQAVASLAAAAAPVAEAAVPVSALPAETVAAATQPADAAEESYAVERESGKGAEADAIDAAAPASGLSEAPPPREMEPDTAAALAQPAALEASGSAAILDQAFGDDVFVAKESSPAAPAKPEGDAERVDQAVEQGPSPNEAVAPAQEETVPVQEAVAPVFEADAPAQAVASQSTAGPEEDPADLFELPAAAGQATIADEAPVEAAAPMEPAQPAEPREPTRAVPPPPMRAIPRPPLSDPLAAVRDLSDEERIALFS